MKHQVVKRWDTGKSSATVAEDSGYKPSAPDMPLRRFYVDTESYRWEVYVWRCRVKETGTAVYYARTEEGHSAYGMTVNEAVNDLAAIMLEKIRTNPTVRTIPFDEVRFYLDPADAAREQSKISTGRSRKSLLARLMGR
jgi:hypothetical protein